MNARSVRSISLAFVIAACSAAPSASPPTASDPAPPTAVATVTVAHPLPREGLIEPGTYLLSSATEWGVPPFDITFTVPVDGWASWGPGVRSAVESWQVDLGFTKVASVIADPCRWQASELIPVGGGEEMTLSEALEVQPHFSIVHEKDIVIDGWLGGRIDMTLDPALDVETCDDGEVYSRVGFHGGKRWHNVAGMTETLWELNVDGTRLVIFSGAMPGASGADRGTVDEIVASLDIEVSD